MYRAGDTLVFDPESFNPEFWNRLSEEDKYRYYGSRFYHRPDDWNNKFETLKPKLMTFICEHHPQQGHCVLMDMSTGQLYPMCHPCNFRLVSDEEC